MKKLIILLILLTSTFSFSFSQDKGENKKGFDKSKLFTGGSLTLSFFTGGAILGANPIFGYQLADWVDAGVEFGYTYQGRRDYIYLNDKFHQHVLGPGAFVRFYPVKFLFVQGQFENNFTTVNYYDPTGLKTTSKFDANSFLAGIGLAEGRQSGSNTFYYISLLFDVLKNPNSPYVNNVYGANSSGQQVIVRTDISPILRAGINIGLFQGHRNSSNYNERGNGEKRPRNYQE